METLTILTVAMMAFSYGVDYFPHNAEQTGRLIGTVNLGVMEIAVLAAGFIAKRFCRIKHDSMYGKSTLTVRYQTNEAYEMSRAMIPAYALSFTLKQSTIVVLSAYFASNDMSLTGYTQDYRMTKRR